MQKFALGVVFAVAMFGCAPQGESNTANPSKPEDKPFRVALLTPGPVNDAGWNQMALDGLTAIEGKLSAKVNNEESTGSKIADSMRSYATEGYDLVFGHGYEYNAPAMAIAKDFPNTVFVSSSGGEFADNVGAFRFNLEQGFYVAGYYAAMTSKSGKVGTVAIQGIPSIDSTLKAFVAGAKAAKPEIEVKEVKLASDRDVASARQATLAMLESGVDVVIHQANNAASGVFTACKERGAKAIGANANQNNDPSGAVVASAIILAEPAFLDLATRVKEGGYKGAIELYGMEKGAIDFVLAENSGVSPETVDAIKALVEDIKSGKVDVPRDTF